MIVMELCDHGALREVIKHKLSWQLYIRLALDIAKGLAFLHENHIIHRLDVLLLLLLLLLMSYPIRLSP
jgi:serine/threonine protein kinase